MTVAVEDLLDLSAREMDCYMRVRDALRPLSLRLTSAIREFLANPGEAELESQVRALRAQFQMRGLQVAAEADELSRCRGAFDALWEAVPAMTPPQQLRFDALVGRARELRDEREEYEQVATRLRGLLLLFEEMAV